MYWIISLLLILGGAIGFYFCRLSHLLYNIEVEGMKRGGLFMGESEYMRTFRVARAEFDSEHANRWTKVFAVVCLLGVGGIATLVVVALCAGG